MDLACHPDPSRPGRDCATRRAGGLGSGCALPEPATLRTLWWESSRLGPLGPRVDLAKRSSRRDRVRAGATRGKGVATGPCDPQGEVGCRAKTRAYTTIVSEQMKSMANLLLFVV